MKKMAVPALMIETLAGFGLALLCGLMRPLSWAYGLMKWFIVPAGDAVAAFLAVKKGLNPYAAWLIAPFTATVAGALLSMGLAPEAGGILLCAFAALLGAAAGDVWCRAARKSSKGRKHGTK